MCILSIPLTWPISFPQDYLYPDAKDRQFLRYFYKAASRNEFNVEKYNELRDEMAEVGWLFHSSLQKQKL